MNRKAAVLIADSYAQPFPDIKKQVHPDIWKFASQNKLDIFYMIGTKPTKLQNILVNYSDKTRYSKFWPAQRIFDILQLCRFNLMLPKVKLSGNVLLVDIPEGLRYLGVKLLASLQYLNDEDYDLVYKTTLSSMVNPELFLEIINTTPLSKPIYAGTLIKFPRKIFVSGANLLLNKESINRILKKKYFWNHGDLDDVAVSNLLKGVEITHIESLNISTINEAQQITSREIENIVHYRCRTAGPIRTDIEVMKVLHNRIESKL